MFYRNTDPALELLALQEIVLRLRLLLQNGIETIEQNHRVRKGLQNWNLDIFRRLLDISISNSEKDAHHFALLQRTSIFSYPSSSAKNESYFLTLENVMSQMGVNIVWYESHDEIPGLLKGIAGGRTIVGQLKVKT